MSRERRISPQHRLSERVTRSRLRLEAKRSVVPLAVMVVGALVAGLGFAYIYSQIGAGSGAKQTVRFAARDTTGLVPRRAEVRFKGIPAGIVDKVEIENGQAVVTATVLEKWGPVYQDARAAIRPNTPLQDMYLDITDRGTEAAGSTLDRPAPASHTDTSTNIADVLQTFEPDVRARMSTLLTDLGAGLDDRGAKLRQTLVEIAPFVNKLGRLSDQLSLRAERTKRMIHNVGKLSQVLAEREQSVRRLIADASQVVGTTATERNGLDGMLRELPATLRELDASFTSVRRILPDLNTAVDRLGPVTDELPGGLEALERVAADLEPPLERLREPVGDLVPLSQNLRPFSARLRGSIDALRPQMSDVDSLTKDIKGCPLAPYMFFQWTASITKFDDSLGAYPTGDFGFGADSLSGVKSPGRVASPSCARGGPKGSEP